MRFATKLNCKRRHWLTSAPGWVNEIAGGWSVQGIYQAQSGPAIAFGNIIFRGDVHGVVLPRADRRVERWFNTDAAFEKRSSQQHASNIRTLRAKAQDAINHAMFASLNTSPTSSLFGQVTGTVSGGQRAITIGGRLKW